ncbi:MAG: DUF4190 domain-containing protein [Verrucomicrobiota bacterium]
MAVIKIACTKCGQRVSGDESFYGTTVECPVCSSIIAFPEPIQTGATTPAASQQASTQPASQPSPAQGQAAQSSPANPHADSAAAAPGQADAGMPTLGDYSTDAPSVQTTSIPLLPENIVTQDANRIGALNAAMNAAKEAEPEEEPPSTLQSVLAMVFGILGLLFFPFGASLVCSPAAIIMGHIALAKARHSRIQPAPGHTLALIGVILGYAGVFVSIVLVATFGFWSKFLGE